MKIELTMEEFATLYRSFSGRRESESLKTRIENLIGQTDKLKADLDIVTGAKKALEKRCAAVIDERNICVALLTEEQRKKYAEAVTKMKKSEEDLW